MWRKFSIHGKLSTINSFFKDRNHPCGTPATPSDSVYPYKVRTDGAASKHNSTQRNSLSSEGHENTNV